MSYLDAIREIRKITSEIKEGNTENVQRRFELMQMINEMAAALPQSTQDVKKYL